MKIKTINAVLCKKFDEFVASIEDESVRSLVESGAIITGGCIASMLLREQMNDFDLYFRDRETTLAVAKYFTGKFNAAYKDQREAQVRTFNSEGVEIESGERIKIYIKSSGVGGDQSIIDQTIEDNSNADEISADTLETDVEPYRVTFLTSNAITLSGKIQCIIRFHGEPDKIHENYDFVHCMNYWTSWERKTTVRPDALESLLTKELRYIGSKYPVCSVIRTRKFIARQWTINAGQYLKMCLQISELDLKDLSVLEDQLVGVDAAYFNQVIRELAQKDKQVVDTGYLMTILDRIF